MSKQVLVGLVAAALLLVSVPAHAAVVDDVEQDPARDRPQYLGGDGADVYGIANVGGRVVVAGAGITEIRNGDGSSTRGSNLSATAVGDPTKVTWTAPQDTVWWDVEQIGNRTDFIAVGRDGAFRFDLTTGDVVWQVDLGGTATTVSRIPNTDKYIVGGTFSPALKVVTADGDLDSGYTVPDVTGRPDLPNASPTKVYRGDVNPQGKRYVFIGGFTHVGGQPRAQAAMLNLGATEATLSPWAPPVLTRDPDGDGYTCGQKFPAYLRSVDYSPDGTWFVLGSTGGPNGPPCDAVLRFDRRNNVPTWVDKTCADTIHSVHVTKDGQKILVGGHFKCIGERPGPPGSPQQFSRYGMAMLRSNGDVSPWKSDKCRGVGARVISDLPGGYGVGYDCRYWGNAEDANPYPSAEFPLARFAFLAS